MSPIRRVPLRGASIALAAIVLLTATPSGHAQIPDTFENLKVLPKEISKDELVETMRGFSFALGVRCQHCHASKPGVEDGHALKDLDFASDARPAKRTARTMMEMVNDLNARYLANLEPKATLSVGCLTCHRGVPRPEPLGAMVQRIAADSGLTVALDRYEALRREHYGSASYDFSQTTLNTVAEAFLKEGKAADAVAVLELNDRHNPSGGWMHMLLGQAYAANGQRDKAVAAYRKALEQWPGNPRIQKALEELEAAPDSTR